MQIFPLRLSPHRYSHRWGSPPRPPLAGAQQLVSCLLFFQLEFPRVMRNENSLGWLPCHRCCIPGCPVDAKPCVKRGQGLIECPAATVERYKIPGHNYSVSRSVHHFIDSDRALVVSFLVVGGDAIITSCGCRTPFCTRCRCAHRDLCARLRGVQCTLH